MSELRSGERLSEHLVTGENLRETLESSLGDLDARRFSARPLIPLTPLKLISGES